MAYLKFNIGETKNVKFHKYAEGKEVEGNYGPQWMYSVMVDGEEMIWYATRNANLILQVNQLKVGDVIKMTRAAEKQYVYVRNGEVLIQDEETLKQMSRSQAAAPAESMSAGALKALNAKVNDIDQRLKKLEGTPMSVASVNASMSEPHASDDIPPEYDVSDIPF